MVCQFWVGIWMIPHQAGHLPNFSCQEQQRFVKPWRETGIVKRPAARCQHFTYIHTFIHTCMHACIHTYIHTYVYTFVFIYPYHLYHFTFTYMTRASISYLYIYTDGTMKIPIPFATSWMELALKSSKETNRFLMGFGGLILEKHT